MFIDSVNCINIYSNGKTYLGRALSNFARIPIHGNGHVFASVEAWWYWFTTGKKHHHLKKLFGYEAKKEGRKFERVYEVTREMFKRIAMDKVNQNPWLINELINSSLPFVHYYEYNGKVVFPEHDITVGVWEEIRKELKGAT